ncbi:MAG: hypothetical protein RRY55_01195 [Bacteroidales bacterium]
MPLATGVFGDVLGCGTDAIPKGGVWLIHGDEKQGKTTLCLLLANYLAQSNKVVYIQAEQSCNVFDIDKIFVEAMQRVGIGSDKRSLSFFGDITPAELTEVLGRKRSADIVFIDNITFAEWVDTRLVRGLTKRFPRKTFVYVAHNDRNGDPNGTTGKAIKRLANTVFVVDALRCKVFGRGSWGGTVNIDAQAGRVMYGGEGIND